MAYLESQISSLKAENYNLSTVLEQTASLSMRTFLQKGGPYATEEELAADYNENSFIPPPLSAPKIDQGANSASVEETKAKLEGTLKRTARLKDGNAMKKWTVNPKCCRLKRTARLKDGNAMKTWTVNPRLEIS